MDEFHDAESQEDYEYVMPLSGTSPDKVSFSDDTKPFRGNRRGSNMTDATDKRHNLKGNEPDDFPLASPPASPRRVSHGIPTLPPLFSVDDENTQDEAAGGESINSASSPTSASVSTSSLSAKTKYHTKKRDSHAMQITMAGDIQEVPIKSSGTTLDTFISDSTGPRGAARPRASTASSMGGSIHSFTGTHDGDDDLDAVSSNYSDTVEPIIFCGITMPMWLSTLIKKPPKMSQISIFLVTVAPCFWCSSKNIQGGSTGTNRAVLTRLNILTICITFIQLFAACWLFTLLLIVDDSPGILKGFAPHFWNLNGASFAVGILAFILIFTCFVTIRVIKEVDLVGAIRYLWLMLWLIPFEIFFTVSLFDRHLVTNVWVRHW